LDFQRKLSKSQLILLNKQVIAKIKFLQKRQQLEAAAKFKIGDIVSFLDPENQETDAMVTHIAPKKIRIMNLKDKTTWTISPSLLTLQRSGDKADLFKLFDGGPKTRK
jgi:hypothetical protein